MNYGIGAPKFYIYDSSGVTLQKTITLSTNIMSDKPIIDEVKISNTSPYTRTKLQESLGYYFRQTLSAGIGDYNSTLLQYQADQANSSKRNDVFKLQQVLTYCNSGYVIKYTPHADLEDLWGFTPITVFVTLEDLGYTGTNKTDSITITVEGTTLRSSAFMWNEFSFTELSGVTNANQCISWNGTTQKGTLTGFSSGNKHSVMMVTDKAVPAASEYVLYGTVGSTSAIGFTATLIFYRADGDEVSVAHGGMTSGTKHMWFVTRDGATVKFYKNNAQIGTTQTLVSSVVGLSIDNIASAAGTAYYSGKLGLIRIMTDTVITETQRALLYNNGYGNYPLDIPHELIYEFNGTGGTGAASETDQSGNSRTLTLVNTPTRTTW